MRTVEWHEGRVRLIDQRRLPWTVAYLELGDYREVAQAISEGAVRGAQAIGVAGAFGMALAAQQATPLDIGGLLEYLDVAAVILQKADATSRHLTLYLARMQRRARDETLGNVREIKFALLAEAQQIAAEDHAACQRIGKHGAALIRNGDTILHHGSGGGLNAVAYGTSLGILRTSHALGRRFHVLVPESRPLLEGANLAAWELHEAGIPFEIIPDSAAGYYMRRSEVKLVLIGASRLAANGDFTACIGAYSLAVLARDNRVPFYAAAPLSSVDPQALNGDQLPQGVRDSREVYAPFGTSLFPEGYPVRNPAYDVVPQRYLGGIVTERGVLYPSFKDRLAELLNVPVLTEPS
ncbi:MAG: S-methyl-5-thioribose-1-phosphate isomerase [Candidatus Thermofonsia Clade 1 bacterium]|uniref:S-methyl-5-thioribose-1-phosphate isomerase n=1 Tax=Candidatus Thermofonsia Clade 1 bacterium TaxID=2364210 RepID=A0A2M8NYY8_9CHLR|nr:MAG: S-methyl-5-thioribose-1-phosphate isomerase [Candidatus Thermofonsia Clade 1 bacterium]